MKVKIQHEFDTEPTYLVSDDSHETELVSLSPAILPADRKRLAGLIKVALESYSEGKTISGLIGEVLGEG